MSYICAELGQPLSNQERRVLLAAAAGLTRKETGVALSIGEQSVMWYRRSILTKLGARNMTHAVAIALREGLFA